MTVRDQGAALRSAIAGKLAVATMDGIVFDLGFGWIPDQENRNALGMPELVIGYTLVFKACSPLLGRPALVHVCTLIGHTPDNDQVDHAITVALEDLRERAAQQLTVPAGNPAPG